MENNTTLLINAIITFLVNRSPDEETTEWLESQHEELIDAFEDEDWLTEYFDE